MRIQFPIIAAVMLASVVTAADAQRRRPGDGGQDDANKTQQKDPNSASGLKPVAPPSPNIRQAPIAIPDRWRVGDTLGLTKNRWWDPYGPNTLKADRPVHGNWFFNLGVISDTILEPRKLPTPVGLQTSERAGSASIFGGGEQTLFNQNLAVALVYYQGDTTFRPPDWEFRLTPVFNANITTVEERRVTRIDPRRGRRRTDEHVGLQEAFIDKHLRNVSSRYDFDSIRIGIQPFSSDFRGFIFQDNQLGVRLFGNRSNNRFQYNLAWFRRLEKDTNSGLNDVAVDLREDDVFIANLYWQDFPSLGYFSQITVLHNKNREAQDGNFFDDNGFLARPASIGNERGRDYDATYLGYNGDGHFGRLNITVAAYYLFGDESQGIFSEGKRDIRAAFAATELSADFDWSRLRFSALYASGDDDPFDDEANGFDAIFENPVFAGADTSFWQRQAVPLIGGGGVTISTRNGLLNSLRSSKELGQSNFANPGLILAGIGSDHDLTPNFRLSFNFNYLRFEDTATLEVARNQGGIDRELGYDLSAAAIWRPLMSQNIVTRVSGSVLLPGDGFKQLFPDETPYSVLINLIFAY